MKTPTRAAVALSSLTLALSALTFSVAQADEVIGAPVRSTANGGPLNNPLAIVADPNGKIYVASTNTSFIQSFTPSGAGYAQGTAISGGFALLGQPFGLSADSSGNLWIADVSPDQILRFTKASAGNVSPQLTISGSNTALNNPSDVVLNKSKEIIVANNGDNKILVYAPGTGGNVGPIRTIAGPSTGLNQPLGLALDSAGRIYVANGNTSSVTVYGPTANGDAAPVKTITTNAIQSPRKLAIDSSDNLYVTAGGFGVGDVMVFAPGASGPAVPIRRLSSAITSFGIALDSNRKIYLTDASTYSAHQFAPLMPFLRPSAARSVKVSGSSKTSTRKISWSAPSKNGGTPITKYRVVVKKGSKTLYSKYTTSRSYKVSRSKLKNGTNTVLVYAYNKVGSAPVAKKNFTVKK